MVHHCCGCGPDIARSSQCGEERVVRNVPALPQQQPRPKPRFIVVVVVVVVVSLTNNSPFSPLIEANVRRSTLESGAP